MKSESVVIADQQAAVNTFSGLVHTARQANKVGGGRRASQEELSRIQRWGLSRNKVSLAEAGDGSPPFYIKTIFDREQAARLGSLIVFLSYPKSGNLPEVVAGFILSERSESKDSTPPGSTAP